MKFGWSHQIAQKLSQSHFRIQTRSQRHSGGDRPRRLTKDLQDFNRHLDVPRDHTILIEFQILLVGGKKIVEPFRGSLDTNDVTVDIWCVL
jgi:hypothetical protein